MWIGGCLVFTVINETNVSYLCSFVPFLNQKRMFVVHETSQWDWCIHIVRFWWNSRCTADIIFKIQITCFRILCVYTLLFKRKSLVQHYRHCPCPDLGSVRVRCVAWRRRCLAFSPRSVAHETAVFFSRANFVVLIAVLSWKLHFLYIILLTFHHNKCEWVSAWPKVWQLGNILKFQSVITLIHRVKKQRNSID